MRDQQNIEAYESVCNEIKDIGRDIGGIVGGKLSASVPGGDYRDMRMFLRRAGCGIETLARIDGLLVERDYLDRIVANIPKPIKPTVSEWWRK
jgi:predicted DNA-binding protein (UPF0278 family)